LTFNHCAAYANTLDTRFIIRISLRISPQSTIDKADTALSLASPADINLTIAQDGGGTQDMG